MESKEKKIKEPFECYFNVYAVYDMRSCFIGIKRFVVLFALSNAAVISALSAYYGQIIKFVCINSENDGNIIFTTKTNRPMSRK